MPSRRNPGPGCRRPRGRRRNRARGAPAPGRDPCPVVFHHEQRIGGWGPGPGCVPPPANTAYCKANHRRVVRPLQSVIFTPCGCNVGRLSSLGVEQHRRVPCVDRRERNTPRLHADRAAGGHQHHRPSGRPAPAGRPGRPRGRPAGQCVNNLKQIGLALPAITSVAQVLPPGYVSNFDASGNDTGPGWGGPPCSCRRWSRSRFSTRSTSTCHRALTNSTSRLTDQRLPVPVGRVADVVAGRRATASASPTRASARWRRPTTSASSAPATRIDGDGIFYRDSTIGLRDVTDGAAQTLAVGEQSHALGEATWAGSVTGAVLFPDDQDGVGYPGTVRPRHGPRPCRRAYGRATRTPRSTSSTATTPGE